MASFSTAVSFLPSESLVGFPAIPVAIQNQNRQTLSRSTRPRALPILLISFPRLPNHRFNLAGYLLENRIVKTAPESSAKLSLGKLHVGHTLSNLRCCCHSPLVRNFYRSVTVSCAFCGRCALSNVCEAYAPCGSQPKQLAERS